MLVMLQISKTRARHVVFVEVCYQTLAERSRGRQSNASTVDPSCTSRWRKLKGVDAVVLLQNHKNSTKQRITWIQQRTAITARSWRATSRTSSNKCACMNKDTCNPTWKNSTVANFEKELRRFFYRTGLLQKSTRIVQWKRENMTRQASEPDAAQWSSWSSWTWDLHKGLHGGPLRRHKLGDTTIYHI